MKGEKGNCGHVHDDPWQEFTCRSTAEIAAEFNRPCVFGILGDGGAAVSIYGNETAHALMMKETCEVILQQKRPKCPMCADAYDRISMVHNILKTTPARC